MSLNSTAQKEQNIGKSIPPPPPLPVENQQLPKKAGQVSLAQAEKANKKSSLARNTNAPQVGLLEDLKNTLKRKGLSNEVQKEIDIPEIQLNNAYQSSAQSHTVTPIKPHSGVTILNTTPAKTFSGYKPTKTDNIVWWKRLWEKILSFFKRWRTPNLSQQSPVSREGYEIVVIKIDCQHSPLDTSELSKRVYQVRIDKDGTIILVSSAISTLKDKPSPLSTVQIVNKAGIGAHSASQDNPAVASKEKESVEQNTSQNQPLIPPAPPPPPLSTNGIKLLHNKTQGAAVLPSEDLKNGINTPESKRPSLNEIIAAKQGLKKTLHKTTSSKSTLKTGSVVGEALCNKIAEEYPDSELQATHNKIGEVVADSKLQATLNARRKVHAGSEDEDSIQQSGDGWSSDEDDSILDKSKKTANSTKTPCLPAVNSVASKLLLPQKRSAERNHTLQKGDNMPANSANQANMTQ